MGDPRTALERAEISAVDVNVNGAASNSGANVHIERLRRNVSSTSSRNYG